MTAQPTNQLLKDLGDGLVLRRATSQDADRLAAFDGQIHGDDAFEQNGIAAWVRDLASGSHPTFNPEDFTLVEDTRSGEIVSSLNLISQTWSFGSIPIKIGRPELVGTNAAYRTRGLVREQFAVIHEWSRQRGELAQAITGIPYYYRQFGYEMTLELSGGWVSYATQRPKAVQDGTEPYRVRPAVESDLPWLLRMEQRAQKRSLVRALRDEAHLRYELLGMSADNINRLEFRVIETNEGQPVGMLSHPGFLWGTMQTLFTYELEDGVAYSSATPSVARYLWAFGEDSAKRMERQLLAIGFWLGSEHPAYHAASALLVQRRPPYAFYLRVPDLPAFLRQITALLEQRLAESPEAGFSGDLRISFYRAGLRMTWEQGRLTGVEAWQPVNNPEREDARFPDQTFLHLLFGYRSLKDVQYMFPDCYANEKATALLEVLFPQRPSSVWVIS